MLTAKPLHGGRHTRHQLGKAKHRRHCAASTTHSARSSDGTPICAGFSQYIECSNPLVNISLRSRSHVRKAPGQTGGFQKLVRQQAAGREWIPGKTKTPRCSQWRAYPVIICSVGTEPCLTDTARCCCCTPYQQAAPQTGPADMASLPLQPDETRPSLRDHSAASCLESSTRLPSLAFPPSPPGGGGFRNIHTLPRGHPCLEGNNLYPPSLTGPDKCLIGFAREVYGKPKIREDQARDRPC